MEDRCSKAVRISFFALAAFSLLVMSLVSNPLIYAEERSADNVQDVSGVSKTSSGTTALDMALAMGIPESAIEEADFSEATNFEFGAEVLPAEFDDGEPLATFGGSPIAGFPTDGADFAAISSGAARDIYLPNAEPSHSYVLESDSAGPDHDVTILRVVMNPPTGAQSFCFNWKFLSDEYPEFVNTAFNDFFLVESHANNIATPTYSFDGLNPVAPDNVAYDSEGNLITINTTGNLGMTAEQAADTTYDGATAILNTCAPIPDAIEVTNGESTLAEQMTLFFIIGDVSDHIYDSTALIDNFEFDKDAVTGGGGDKGAITDTTDPEIICDIVVEEEIASLEDEVILDPGSTISVQATLLDPSTDEGIEGKKLDFDVKGTKLKGSDTTDEAGDAAVTFDLSKLKNGFYFSTVKFKGDSEFGAASCSTLFLIGESEGSFELSFNGLLDNLGNPIAINVKGSSFASAELTGEEEVALVTELIAGPAFEIFALQEEESDDVSVVIGEDFKQEVDSAVGAVTVLPDEDLTEIGTLLFFNSGECEDCGDEESLSASKLLDADLFSFGFLIFQLSNEDHTTIVNGKGNMIQGDSGELEAAEDCDFLAVLSEEEAVCDPAFLFDSLGYINDNTFEEDPTQVNELKGGVAPADLSSGFIEMCAEAEGKIKKIVHIVDVCVEGEWESEEGNITLLDEVTSFTGDMTIFNTKTENEEEHTLTITDAEVNGNKIKVKGFIDGNEKNKIDLSLTFEEDVAFEDGAFGFSDDASIKFNIGKTKATFKGGSGDYLVSE